MKVRYLDIFCVQKDDDLFKDNGLVEHSSVVSLVSRP